MYPPMRSTFRQRPQGSKQDAASTAGGKLVNVTCWHQTAYVSPEREPHCSSHRILNADVMPLASTLLVLLKRGATCRSPSSSKDWPATSIRQGLTRSPTLVAALVRNSLEIWCCWGRCGVSAATTGAWSPRPGSPSTRPRPMCCPRPRWRRSGCAPRQGRRCSPGPAWWRRSTAFWAAPAWRCWLGGWVTSGAGRRCGAGGALLVGARGGRLGDGAAGTVGARHAGVWTASRVPAAAGRGPQTPVLGGHGDAPRDHLSSAEQDPRRVGGQAGSVLCWRRQQLGAPDA